jgi:hypothetical protein
MERGVGQASIRQCLPNQVCCMGLRGGPPPSREEARCLFCGQTASSVSTSRCVLVKRAASGTLDQNRSALVAAGDLSYVSEEPVLVVATVVAAEINARRMGHATKPTSAPVRRPSGTPASANVP